MNSGTDIILELASTSPDCDPLSFAEISRELPPDEGDMNSLAVITWNRFSMTAALQKFVGAAMLLAADPGSVNLCKLLATAVILFGIDAGKARIFKGDEEVVVSCILRGTGSTHYLDMDRCKELIPDAVLLSATIQGLKDEGFLKEADGRLYLSAAGFKSFKVGRG